MTAISIALLALVSGCASEGVQNSQFDANPVHAPGVEYVGDTYDAVTEGTAKVASEVVDGLLTPIKVLFDAIDGVSQPYPVVTQSPTDGMTPEERQSWRRQQMGLPESAESRVAARRSLLRSQMSQQAQPK